MHSVNRRTSMGGAVALALGLSVFLAVPAAQAKQPETAPTTPAATATINVPSGFDQKLEDKRANGDYQVVGTGLHILTVGDPTVNGSTMKVAEYVDTQTPLSAVGTPSLDYTETDPTAKQTDPGFQLVVDLDGNGTPDGILVGEPGAYGDSWWLTRPWTDVSLTNAPGAAFGYDHAGTLAQWDTAFGSAQVLAFGFSLGSGVYGDGTVNAIHFADTTYTFAKDVVLTGKDECKGGGWATSTAPVYKNQGECVSRFATASNSGKGTGSGTGTATGTATAPAAPATVTAANAGKIRAI
jgi:hypothetical protein